MTELQIEGEFLTSFDLGPLGRLVAPGETVILGKHDVLLVQDELAWVAAKYREADRKAEALRKRLPRARLGTKGDVVRESFDAWTIEAATLGLCARYLSTVLRQLKQEKHQGANPSKAFRWGNLVPIKEVVQRVVNAPDAEIISGAVFRAG